MAPSFFWLQVHWWVLVHMGPMWTFLHKAFYTFWSVPRGHVHSAHFVFWPHKQALVFKMGLEKNIEPSYVKLHQFLLHFMPCKTHGWECYQNQACIHLSHLVSPYFDNVVSSFSLHDKGRWGQFNKFLGSLIRSDLLHGWVSLIANMWHSFFYFFSFEMPPTFNIREWAGLCWFCLLDRL